MQVMYLFLAVLVLVLGAGARQQVFAAELPVEECGDYCLIRSLEIATGFLERGVPRSEWEDQLQGMQGVLISEGQIQEHTAEIIVDTARDLLNAHGHDPELLRAMLADLT